MSFKGLVETVSLFGGVVLVRTIDDGLPSLLKYKSSKTAALHTPPPTLRSNTTETWDKLLLANTTF